MVLYQVGDRSRFHAAVRRKEAAGNGCVTIPAFPPIPLRPCEPSVTETQHSSSSASSPDPALQAVVQRGRNLALVAAFLGWMFDGMEMGIFLWSQDPVYGRWRLRTNLLLPMCLVTSASGWVGSPLSFFLAPHWVALFLDGWRQGGSCAGHVLEHPLLFRIHRAVLFCNRTLASHDPSIHRCLGHGGRMVPRRRPRHGIMARQMAIPSSGTHRSRSQLRILAHRSHWDLFPIQDDSWRWVMLIGAAPALLTFLIRLFVPESKLWKESKSKGPNMPLREIFAPLSSRTPCWLSSTPVSR